MKIAVNSGTVKLCKTVAIAFFLIVTSSCGPYISLPPYPPPPSKNQPTISPGRSENPLLKESGPRLIVPQTSQGKQDTGLSQSIPEKKTPQRVASLELVKEARELSLSGKVDIAIEYLERAIELDSYNGDAFYEMARCWEMKGNHGKALTFVDRSIRIFQGRPKKLRKSYLLKAAILKAEGKEEESRKILDFANSLKEPQQ